MNKKSKGNIVIIINLCKCVSIICFSIKFVSNQIATPAEAMYPYDYVYLACSQDNEYFEQLETECEASVTRFPMVRATTLDATERPENFRDTVVQQGQNIGISESTFRKLKEAVGESSLCAYRSSIDGTEFPVTNEA